MNFTNARVGMVWVEAVRDDTAPAMHLEGTLRRLEALGYSRSALLIVSQTTTGTLRRLVRILYSAVALLSKTDVIITRWHPVLLPFYLVARLRRRPVLALVQGSYTDIFTAHPKLRIVPGSERLVKASLKHVSAIMVPHSGIKDLLTNTVSLSVPISVLPNGHPVSASATDAACTIQAPEDYVLYSGNLADWQGVDTMLAAVEHESWPKQVRLLIVGDGANAHSVASTASPNLIYMGRLPNADVRALLRGAICSLSPKRLSDATRSGVSPFKLMEAGLEARPIIATSVPGQTEYVEQFNCGLLIEPDSPRALAEAVSYLFRNKGVAHQMGRSGRIAAEERSWERGASQLGSVLSKMLTSL